jgi:hypothetical protein
LVLRAVGAALAEREHRDNGTVSEATAKLIEEKLNRAFELKPDDTIVPLDTRKATLASVLRRAAPGLRFNEHMEGDGPAVFAHACKLGFEGIVSKRKDSAYRISIGNRRQIGGNNGWSRPFTREPWLVSLDLKPGSQDI